MYTQVEIETERTLFTPRERREKISNKEMDTRFRVFVNKDFPKLGNL